jgi:hypothetical protein
MATQNPELSVLADRLAEAERQTDAARELCRRLLHDLTDARLALDAITTELRDLDARPVLDQWPVVSTHPGHVRALVPTAHRNQQLRLAASSTVSFCGRAPFRSMPSSSMTVTTSGWTRSPGLVPAEKARPLAG